MKTCNKELMGKSGLYTIINEINGKWYVGSTKNSFSKRFSKHLDLLRKNRHSNPHLQGAYNKYGDENFSFVIVKVLRHSKAIKEEQKVLDSNIGKDYCYNICSNATAPMSGRKHTPETIAKLQAISRSRAKEIGECTRRHRLGSKHTEKTIKRMRKSAKVRDDTKRIAVLKSKEFKEKISRIMTGKKLTPEQLEDKIKRQNTSKYKRMMSKATKGIKKSDTMKGKASFARLGKKIVFVNERGCREEVISLRKFAEKYGLNRKELSRIAIKNGKPYYGWHLQ